MFLFTQNTHTPTQTSINQRHAGQICNIQPNKIAASDVATAVHKRTYSLLLNSHQSNGNRIICTHTHITMLSRCAEPVKQIVALIPVEYNIPKTFNLEMIVTTNRFRSHLISIDWSETNVENISRTKWPNTKSTESNRMDFNKQLFAVLFALICIAAHWYEIADKQQTSTNMKDKNHNHTNSDAIVPAGIWELITTDDMMD